MKDYCDYCKQLVTYTTHQRDVHKTFRGKEIIYVEEYQICDICQNEFYVGSSFDKNIEHLDQASRQVFDIITKKEIKQILEKYNIGKKPLSLVLGWGETTITRYLDGQYPEKMYSDVLKKILNDPNSMLEYLDINQDRITPLAIEKVKTSIQQLQNQENQNKIFLVTKYIISKIGDITPLAIEKLLFFTQGFSTIFLPNIIFKNQVECWVHGPVYREIFNRFSTYKYNPIAKSEFDQYQNSTLLTENEKQLIDTIIRFFGCYSAPILEEMTHLTAPWQNGRKGLSDNQKGQVKITVSDLTTYFEKIKDDYHIVTYEDIGRYSSACFQSIMK